MENKFVLIIHQNIEEASEIRDQLEAKDIHSVFSSSLKKGIELLLTIDPSLIILSSDMTQIDNYGSLDLSEKASQRLIPLLVITDPLSSAEKVSLYQNGAFDVIERPIDYPLFTQLISTRRTFAKMLDNELILDKSTGAYNRKTFFEHMQKRLFSYTNDPSTFSAALIDVDGLKEINRRAGFMTGDVVIKKLLHLINRFSDTTTVYRLSSKEFLLIFENLSMDDAVTRTTELALEFKTAQFPTELGDFQPTISASLSFWDSPKKSVGDLLKELDTAMQIMKDAGGNHVLPYSSSSEHTLKRNIRVILIDDDPIVQAMLQKHFAMWQMDKYTTSIQSFKSGYEFVHSDWYDTSTYYVFLLDGIMPKMTGFEVLEYVRSNYLSDRIIIAMLTSRNSSTDIEQALKLGADDYLTKPFRPKEVVLKIERLVRRLFG